MRWLLITLLLVNVVYLGWELDQQTKIEMRNNRAVNQIPASVPRLQLLQEATELPEVRRQDTVGGQADIVEVPADEFTTSEDLVADLPDILLADPDNLLPPKSCYRYGPVADENLANDLQQWFTDRSIASRLLYTEEPGARLFWIYLAPQGSRENALAVLEEMQGKGLGDYRLINRGDLENAISLGLFSSREAVDARLRELQEKGYVPVVVPYQDMKKTYWVDVEAISAAALTDALQNEYPAKHASAQINCDAVSGNISTR